MRLRLGARRARHFEVQGIDHSRKVVCAGLLLRRLADFEDEVRGEAGRGVRQGKKAKSEKKSPWTWKTRKTRRQPPLMEGDKSARWLLSDDTKVGGIFEDMRDKT